MNLQNHSDALGRREVVPEFVLIKVPAPSPLWSLLIQSGWRIVAAKENRVLLAREFIQA